jgi:hypothetical protein
MQRCRHQLGDGHRAVAWQAGDCSLRTSPRKVAVLPSVWCIRREGSESNDVTTRVDWLFISGHARSPATGLRSRGSSAGLPKRPAVAHGRPASLRR